MKKCIICSSQNICWVPTNNILYDKVFNCTDCHLRLWLLNNTIYGIEIITNLIHDRHSVTLGIFKEEKNDFYEIFLLGALFQRIQSFPSNKKSINFKYIKKTYERINKLTAFF